MDNSPDTGAKKNQFHLSIASTMSLFENYKKGTTRIGKATHQILTNIK